ALQKAQVLSWVRPGTNDFSAFDAVDTVSLPEELRQLWSSFNGMSVPEGTLLQYTWLDGTFSYLGVEEAARDFDSSTELWEQDQDFEDYWPKAFVPIGTPGDGSRLLVNCLAGSPTYGSVYELFHGIGVSRMSASLSQYFMTLNACKANGAVTVTDDGKVSIDFDAFQKIGRRMNPGCDHFE
ncbi:MAG: SMI1/KNR4 family protein, partial [Rhizobiaceae bacterium]|nr:SMI1/KNR4 family protein [Rhizobiaceae bacterium]